MGLPGFSRGWILWPLGGPMGFSSPTLTDLGGDGRPEVAIGTTGYNRQTGAYDRPGGVAAMGGNVTLLRWKDLGSPFNSFRAVGELDENRGPVKIGLGGDRNYPRRLPRGLPPWMGRRGWRAGSSGLGTITAASMTGVARRKRLGFSPWG